MTLEEIKSVVERLKFIINTNDILSQIEFASNEDRVKAANALILQCAEIIKVRCDSHE